MLKIPDNEEIFEKALSIYMTITKGLNFNVQGCG